jgi:hypothetical protein
MCLKVAQRLPHILFIFEYPFFSTEYRNAMNQQFPFIVPMVKVFQKICRKIIWKNNNVVHVQQQPAAAMRTTIT